MTSKKLGLAVAATAFLACGVAREIADHGGGECSSCHGDGNRAGTALQKAAPADAAHAAHVEQNSIDCAVCHVVPTTVAHSNGRVDVAFAGVALQDGARPAFASPTCSGVYCHGGTLAAGGKVTTASWIGGPLACDACHGAPPPSHASTSTNCSTCHAGTVRNDGTIDVEGGLHANGTVEVAGGGGAACGSCHAIPPASHASTSTNCNACHPGTVKPDGTIDTAGGLHQNGTVDLGGGAGPACGSCHGIPPASHASTSTNCNGCHPGTVKPDGTIDTSGGLHQNGTVDVSGTAACGSCHAVPPTTGRHPKHVVSKGFACGECHAGYSSSSVNATMHANGSVDVGGNRLTSYDTGSNTCTNSCHGNKGSW